jgi:nitric oxide reductase NorQ protein
MTDIHSISIHTPAPSDFLIEKSPYYEPVANECAIFEASHKQHVPILLKGPTGCGKTRFIHHMAHKLQRPLITVSCHEDLSASDLIGRFLIKGSEVFWSDGPMTAAVRMGAILYLDEVVEARKDTIVAIHSLTDHRRSLSIDKLATNIFASDDFSLVISYNPGYQSLLKELKPSTRQRFISLSFDYPNPEKETLIIHKESGLPTDLALLLAKLAQKIRHLTTRGLNEGVSTRLLVHAARLMQGGISTHDACRVAFTQTLSDDPVLCSSIAQLILDFFPENPPTI